MDFKDPKVIKKISFFIDQLMQEWSEEMDRYSRKTREYQQSEDFFAKDYKAQEEEREVVEKAVRDRLDKNR